MKSYEKIFYERHVPELIRQISRLADAVEAQNAINEKLLVLEKKKIIKANESVKNQNNNKENI